MYSIHYLAWNELSWKKALKNDTFFLIVLASERRRRAFVPNPWQTVCILKAFRKHDLISDDKIYIDQWMETDLLDSSDLEELKGMKWKNFGGETYSILLVASQEFSNFFSDYFPVYAPKLSMRIFSHPAEEIHFIKTRLLDIEICVKELPYDKAEYNMLLSKDGPHQQFFFGFLQLYGDCMKEVQEIIGHEIDFYYSFFPY